jgi:hypothetical protein
MAPVTAAEKATVSIDMYGPARTAITGTPLNAEDLRKLSAEQMVNREAESDSSRFIATC